MAKLNLTITRKKKNIKSLSYTEAELRLIEYKKILTFFSENLH